MRFVFIIIENDRSRRSVAADRSRHRAGIETWMGEQARAGVLVGGEAFETEAVPAVTIRRAEDLTTVVTEGPFAGPEETLGGYVLVEATDMAAAVGLAATWPATGEVIEVRPVWRG